ncbi:MULTISPECIES: YbbC/YhhH family protein [Epilithonimonas]|uniref:NTF2 fold domain-containing protein n=1 Tax=Epilithonimonas hispanica TaxID=358687 RepID=A0A3D9D1D9_9FLAO|nr:YbbC/YhhH family protein [Epilithonimonas vandammei]REC71728.1 hypothetical protein DRF58_05115 [Epilithonimonas hispanica]
MKLNILFFSLIFFISCEQKVDYYIGENSRFASNQLSDAIKNKQQFNSLKPLITDEETAVKVAEPILFKIYGQEKIKEERPYEINKVNNYWIINGTMENSELGTLKFGGTFNIIIDSNNGEVIQVTHGK